LQFPGGHDVKKRSSWNGRELRARNGQSRPNQSIESRLLPVALQNDLGGVWASAKITHQVTVSETSNSCELGRSSRVLAVDQHFEILAACIECLHRLDLGVIILVHAALLTPASVLSYSGCCEC
jgi:hypothetical protein